MRIVRLVFGALFLLGGLFCAALAYLTAGGQHGWGEFEAGRLLSRQNDAVVFTCGAICLLVVGGIMTFQRRRAGA